MDGILEEEGRAAVDQAKSVTMVLEAIDQLLDAMEHVDAPITCELLRTAMMALVHECKLGDPRTAVAH